MTHLFTLKWPGIQMAGQIVAVHVVFLNLCEDIVWLYLWIQGKI